MKNKNIRATRKLKKANFIIINILGIIILVVLGFYFLSMSLSNKKSFKLNYTETNNIDYSVCLKENDFYEDECISKDMKYVASLIDVVHINLEHIFSTSEYVDSEYTYSVVAKLIISDPSDEDNVIFSKSYSLIDEKKEEAVKTKFNVINKNIDINYGEYNDLANSFKSTYGISSNARLEINLVINNKGNLYAKKSLTYNKKSLLMVSLPLSESAININIDYAKENKTGNLIEQTGKKIGNMYCFIVGIVCSALCIIVFISFVYQLKKRSRKSKYEIELNRLLREYDRLIVESNNTINLKLYNVIEVKKFEELLDARDNLKLPIIFNEISRKSLSCFYIKYERDIYIYILKASKNGEKHEKN